MSIINNAKEGVDLTHPKATVNYVVVAVIGIAVIGLALWIYGKAKGAASGVTGKVSNVTSGIESQASKQLEGFL